MKYKVRVPEPTTITYLGTFEKGDHDLSEEDVTWFERSVGVPIESADLPEGVKLLKVTNKPKGEGD